MDLGRHFACRRPTLDGGPKVGKGSPALARQVSGLPVSNAIDLKSRYDGQVRCPDVLLCFLSPVTSSPSGRG